MSCHLSNGIAAGLLVLLTCGCGTSQPSTAPSPSSPSQAEVKPAEVQPTAAAPRTFDAAAEKELKAKGHFGPMAADEAARTYAGVRWRFEAEVVRLDAAEPSRFHLLTITVQPDGLAPTYIRLRSREDKDKLYPGQKHLFEGTFERYILQSGLDALVFNDGIIVTP